MPASPLSDEMVVVRPETTFRQRATIIAYIGFLYLVLPFAGVWGTTARFLLKDHYHLPANDVANFLFWVGFPSYIGFLFGLVRDRWNPFGQRDQGFLMLFTGISAVLLVSMYLVPTTYVGLILLFVLSSIIGQFISSAVRGLTSVLGQERLMSGRLASVWWAAAQVPAIILDIVAGKMAAHYPPHLTFGIAAVIAFAVFLFMLWRPKFVFDDPAETAPVVHRKLSQDVVRLFRAPGILPITILLLLWNFTPGAGTPMQFYLTNTLHGTAEQFGYFNAIFAGFFMPTFLLYGFLCTRINFRKLLWVCTFIAVPQILPLLIVHSADTALIAAVPMGLMGGLATAAYFGLLIRACPPGLHGTAMMLGASVWALSDQLGNVAGAHLYKIAGFAPCAWATFFVYACLIPVIPFLPKHLTATKDGEVSADMMVA